jgi:hypothetical protein
MKEIFIPNLVIRPFYPPMHGVPGSSQRKGIRTQSGATVFYVDPDNAEASDDNKGWDADYPLETIGQAVENASDEDYIFISPGEYDETVTVDKSVTIVGLGGSSAVIINPTTVGAEGMSVEADDVQLINISIFGETDSDYALAIADGYNRFSAFNCEFAGPDANVVQATGNVNVLFQECSFSGGGNGLEIIDGAVVVPDAIIVKDCFFSDLTDAHIEGAATAATRLIIDSCIHDGNTVPTAFYNIDGVGTTGIVSNCRIAHATNDDGVLEIAAGVFWVANMTEAGVTAARPA